MEVTLPIAVNRIDPLQVHLSFDSMGIPFLGYRSQWDFTREACWLSRVRLPEYVWYAFTNFNREVF